jgi:hypothetical protein
MDRYSASCSIDTTFFRTGLDGYSDTRLRFLCGLSPTALCTAPEKRDHFLSSGDYTGWQKCSATNACPRPGSRAAFPTPSDNDSTSIHTHAPPTRLLSPPHLGTLKKLHALPPSVKSGQPQHDPFTLFFWRPLSARFVPRSGRVDSGFVSAATSG